MRMPSGVFEEGGVIAGRPGAIFRRANDLSAEIAHGCVQCIDVFARAQAEAEMV